MVIYLSIFISKATVTSFFFRSISSCRISLQHREILNTYIHTRFTPWKMFDCFPWKNNLILISLKYLISGSQTKTNRAKIIKIRTYFNTDFFKQDRIFKPKYSTTWITKPNQRRPLIKIKFLDMCNWFETLYRSGRCRSVVWILMCNTVII